MHLTSCSSVNSPGSWGARKQWPTKGDQMHSWQIWVTRESDYKSIFSFNFLCYLFTSFIWLFHRDHLSVTLFLCFVPKLETIKWQPTANNAYYSYWVLGHFSNWTVFLLFMRFLKSQMFLYKILFKYICLNIPGLEDKSWLKHLHYVEVIVFKSMRMSSNLWCINHSLHLFSLSLQKSKSRF